MHKALHNKVYLKIAFSLCYRFGIQLHTKYQFSCYNPIKTLFLTVVIVVTLWSYSLYTQVMVTVILIDVQYLLNVAFKKIPQQNSPFPYWWYSHHLLILSGKPWEQQYYWNTLVHNCHGL